MPSVTMSPAFRSFDSGFMPFQTDNGSRWQKFCPQSLAKLIFYSKLMWPVSHTFYKMAVYRVKPPIFAIIATVCFAVSAARAETIDVFDNHGGSVAAYDQRWAGLAQRGVSVRIVGPCQSACTVLLGHIPRSRICVTPEASFGFHLAHLQQATATLWRSYPSDIRTWINTHGGLTSDFIWMRAPDIYRFFHKC